MKVWRITRERHVAAAFSGEGARRFAARWNPAGVPVVYTSLSLALAAMETLVHADLQSEPTDLMYLEAEVPATEEEFDREQAWTLQRLPSSVREIVEAVTQSLGAEWADSRRSLALPVPSATIEGDWNLLINPLHPAAVNIVVEPPRPFRYDARLFRRLTPARQTPPSPSTPSPSRLP